LAVLAALSVAPASVYADSLTIRGSGGGTLMYTVDVDHIDAGYIFYRLNGELKSRPLDEVAALRLDDEPDFNAGAAAYDAQDWTAAATGFFRAMNGTDKHGTF
jgi:hypothetical protein